MTVISDAGGSSRWRIPRKASSARPGQTIMALAIAGFGIGLTQGGAASVIQDQTRDLNTSVEMLGYTMVAYAMGVVIGSPILMMAMGRLNRRTVVLSMSFAFIVTTSLTIIAPNIESLLLVRFLSGFPHGALLGSASFIAMTALGRERRGRALAIIMLGLAVANIVGVPTMQYVSELYSWRASYSIVAVVGLIAFGLMWWYVPSVPGNSETSARREMASLANPQVWIAVLVVTIGFAGLGAVFSYVVPLLEDLNGFSATQTTWILVAWGTGLSIGALLGGRLSDHSNAVATRIGITSTLCALTLLSLLGDRPAFTVAALILLAVSMQVFSQAVQANLMDVVHTSPSLGSALSHSALNAATSLGTSLGAIVLTFGWGYLGPARVALGLTLVALILVLCLPQYRLGTSAVSRPEAEAH